LNLTDKEQELIEIHRKLNADGQNLLLENAYAFAHSTNFKKTTSIRQKQCNTT